MRETPKALNTKLLLEIIMMALVKYQGYSKKLRDRIISNGWSAGSSLSLL